MKLKELIERVDRTISELVDVFNFGYSCFNLGDSYGFAESERLTASYISSWYCTDSQVGTKVYFFDGKPVAVGHKPYRKADEDIEWISEELFYTVREYVKSVIEEHDEKPSIDLIDLDTEMDESFKIEFRGNVFQNQRDNCFYNGFKVKMIKDDDSMIDYINNQSIKYDELYTSIQFENGTIKNVLVKDLDFPYNIK